MTISITSDPEINDFPRLTRFYGLSFQALCDMPRWARRLYVNALPGLEAEEQLGAMQVSEYPHVDEKSRKKIHRAAIARLETESGEAIEPTAPTIDLVASPEDARKKLSGIGIAVVMEPPPAPKTEKVS